MALGWTRSAGSRTRRQVACSETWTTGAVGEEAGLAAANQIVKGEGKLDAQDQHEYVLKVSKGQRMTATIQSPRNDVLLGIYGFEDGQPLVRVPMGATTWTGVLPATQDYSIKAVAAGGPTSYKMDVTVK